MKTVKLYQQDVYQRAFDARVLRVLEDGEGDLLILDQTAFFPEGGGQPCDRGTLDRFPVDKVWEQGGLILHRLPGGSGLRAGDQVSGVLDWERRFLHMQRHCGEHILSGIFYRLCGGVNRGFHMGEDYMTIDISLEEEPSSTELTPELTEKAELLANRAVWANLPVITRRFESREEAAQMPLRKQLALDEDITIVCVGSPDDPADCVACCGTHPAVSGQVGLIKIYKTERYKGMFRIYFDAGENALNDYRRKHRLVDLLNRQYSASADDLPDKLRAQEERNRAVRERLHRLRRAAVLEKRKELEGQLSEGRIVTIGEYDGLEPDDLLQIGRPLAEEVPGLLVLIHRETLTLFFFSDGKRVDCGKLVRETAPIYGGRGGGSAAQARTILPKGEYLPVYLDLLEKHLRP